MKPNSKNPIDLLIIVAVVLLAGVAGTWFFVAGEDEELAAESVLNNPRPADRQAAEIAEAQENQALLDLASLAMASGQLVEPAGSSALDYFERVLEKEPDNALALGGKERVLDTVALASETALAAGDITAATEVLATLQAIAPTSVQTVAVEQMLIERQDELARRAGRLVENGRFDDAEAMLAEATLLTSQESTAIAETRAALDAAVSAAAEEAKKKQQAAAAARPAKTSAPAGKKVAAKAKPSTAPAAKVEKDPTEELFVSAHARLANGKLVEPRSDSALFYYEEIASLAPDHADLASLRSELADALLQRANVSLSAGDNADTGRWLAYVTGLDPENPTLASIRSQLIQREIDKESQRVIPMEQLEIVKFVEPRYPTRAAREKISGWADVQFTVSEDGKPREIEVVEVSKKGYFESATRQAVSKWRFKPREFQGEVIPQRVGVRVSFSFDS